ncbi:MAG: hypothetical protein HOM55_08160 [Proteobacteria bacterium]|jgi:predicted Ser/Thr protein kinase|nr:hypothetical protein [Pseudomonadota bacterium]
MADFLQYSLEELRKSAVEVLRTGQGTRPDVLLIDVDGKRAILKDQNACDRWFAMLIGPLLCWREARALKRLEAISGVPRLLTKPDARSLLMEYVDAEQAIKTQQVQDWQAWFDRLEQLIQCMHEAGIAHGDLRSPGNMLIDKQGNPVLVDFVASSGQGARWNIFANSIFRGLCAVDESAVIKLKSKIAPELLDNAAASNHVGGKVGLLLRALGQRVRKLSRLLFTAK